MEVLLNNRRESFDEDKLSVREILEKKSFTFKHLVIKKNDQLVKKDQYDTCIIEHGDKLDVIHLISGG